MPKLASGLAFAGGLLALAACTKRPLPTVTSGDAGAAGAGAAVSAAVRTSYVGGGASAPAYGGPSSHDLSSYAAKMLSDEIHLAGYDVESITVGEEVPGARPWHDLRGTLAGRTKPERWSLSDDIDVPPNIQGDDLRRAVEGTAVLLTRDATSGAGERGETATSVTFVAAPNSRHVTHVAIGGPEPARRDVVCEHVPSWERPHLLCHSWRDGITSVHRLVGNRWESVPIAADQAKHLRVGAVGPDGALRLGLHTGSVMRIAATGTVETFDMPIRSSLR